MTPRVPVVGRTYHVRQRIKALGGRWDPDRQVWTVPADKSAAAQAIVAGAPTSHQQTRCRVCGHVERRDARGRVDGDRILRSGECQSCYEERRQGY